MHAERRQAGSRRHCRVLLCCDSVRWSRGSPRNQSSPPSTVLRASLRRAVPSFTVEVRRRPRPLTNPSQELQSTETKIRPATFGTEAHRLAAVTFGAVAPNQPSGAGAAAPPQRRILQSLVPEKLPGGSLQDAFLSAATSDPAPRARKSPSVRATNSGGPAPCQKVQRRVQIPIALDDDLVQASAENQRSISPTDPVDGLPTDSADVSRSNRKRTIMGRYVFGDELKPGERWKRRFSKRR